MIYDKAKQFDTSSRSFLWGLFKAETKTPAKGNNKGIVTSIVGEFQDRTRKDIKKWREAIQAAENPENPRWNLWHDLVDDLMTDGHVTANIDIRKAATVGTRFYIESTDGKENEEATALLQTEWFYNLMNDWLDSIFVGTTVHELVDPVTFTWKLIPRRNTCVQFQRVYFEVMGDKYVTYSDPGFAKNVIETRSRRSFGIINDIVPQLIWKRNAQQTWADFADKFGIPLVTAETMETNPKKLDALEAALRGIGQAGQAILPDGTKITIHDSSTKGDPYRIFKEQIETTNSEISKRIVGGTMVSDNGSSRSQSEVHERTLDDKISEADRRMIEFNTNNKLIPLLRMWGFKFAEGDKFVFDRSEELSLKEHWEIVSDVLNNYEVDDTWISKTFNVPIIGKKEKVNNTANGISANFR